ncbi:MAG: VWA domain-containing protein [Betaproteobacteria bacterium]|nr:VWA domain-containing protein [Betaproteobacteria bacterium]
MLAFAAYWPLVFLAGILVIAWFTRRQRTSLSPRRVRAAALVRMGVLSLLVLALMRPTLQTPERDVAVVYALDISRSIAPAFVKSALDAIAGANDKAGASAENLRYVVFADRPRTLQSLSEVPLVAVRGEDETGSHAVDQGGTNLERALSAALLAFPPRHEKHLVLLSDGRQTAGDLWRVLPRLRDAGVRVFSLPAQVAVAKDAWIESIAVPEGVREKETFALRVDVFSRMEAPAKVALFDGNRLLGTQSVQLAAGSNEIAFEARMNTSGRHDMSARVMAEGDEVPRNDALARVLWVHPPFNVLYVEGGAGGAKYLPDALRAQGISVKAGAVEQLADESLQAFDAVILSDVPADKLGAKAGMRLEAYVRDQGGGLIFAAGENSYGKSGFAKSEIERLLPVKFEGKRKRKDIDLVLLIDRSYSMRGKKLEIAKTAALATLDLLDPQHRLAVVAFDARPRDVVPLAEVWGKRRAEDLIGSMTSSGQTNIYPALYRAHQLLQGSQTKTKHVILLSDGISAPPPGVAGAKGVTSDEQMEMVRKARADYFTQWRRDHPGQPLPGVDDLPAEPPPGTFEEIAAKFVQDKITLSTVALGEKPNVELLANLAAWSGGKSYVARNDNEIPGLFIAEAQRLLGESLVEESFRPVVKVNATALGGVDFAAGPELKGLVVSKAKRFSDVLLEGKKNLPLMVETRYGLGKTVAFLSDVKNRWAADWLRWPGYGKLWAQVVRGAARRDGGQELIWSVGREGNEAVVTLSAFKPDGSFRNDMLPKVRVSGTTEVAQVFALRQSAAGTYTERIALPGPSGQPYVFELLSTPSVSAREIARTGPRSLAYAHSDEYRVLPADHKLLRALSEQTGGKFAPEMADIFRHYGDAGTRSRALWPWLAAMALALYLTEVFVRRSPWAFGSE